MAEKKTAKVPKWLKIVLPTLIIGIWLLLGGLGGPYFGRIEEVSDIDLTAFLPKSAEATKVNEEIKKFRDEKTFPAIIVFEKTRGTLSEDDMTALDAEGREIQGLAGITGTVAPPVLADDQKAALIVVPVSVDADQGDVLD